MNIPLSTGIFLCVLVSMITFPQSVPSKPGYGNDVIAVEVGDVGPKIEPLFLLPNGPGNNLKEIGQGE